MSPTSTAGWWRSPTLGMAALTPVLGLSAGLAAAAPEGWQREGERFVLRRGEDRIVFEAPGRLTSGRAGGPTVTTAFFQWHDSWVYERLDSGQVQTGPEVGADGVLRQAGLWGTHETAPALRYALALEPTAEGCTVRLEVEKTGPLTLTSGLWCTHYLDRKAFAAGQRAWLRPQAHGPVGASLEGVCDALLVELTAGHALSLAPEGFRTVRTRGGAQGVSFEMGLHEQSFEVGAKVAVGLRVGFEAMPEQFAGQVLPARDALAIGDVRATPETVARGGRLELAVDLRGTWDNPFDPDDVALDAEVALPSGKTYRLPGFFLVTHKRVVREGAELMVPEGNGRWCVRLAATEAGPLRVVLTARDRSGTVRKEVGPYTVRAEGAGRGFIRQSDVDPHYLRFDNGEGFVPIGHNLPIYHASGQLAEQAIRKMSAAGENYNRWWMSAAGLGLEWEPRLGWYRQAQAARLDAMLDLAAELSFTYMLCMDTHQDFREEGWTRNPFNQANGGPCATVKDWFTNDTARKFYRNRLRYTVARWAYAPQVLCWEFGNEFEGWADTDEATKIAWHREMTDVLVALDPYRHPITTSWWGHTGPTACWDIPRQDIVQTHCYTNNDANVAEQVRRYCLQQWDRYAKPHIFGEFGIRSHSTTADKDPKGWGLHNANWSALASGACGIPMPWWHENYIEPLDLYFHFTAIANFARGLPFGSERWERLEVPPPEYVTAPATPPTRDVVLTPVSTWGKARTTDFRVAADGSVNDPDALHELLHGNGHADLRNGPTFQVTYPQPGRFIVRVGRVSRSGRLQVWVDDRQALDREFPCGEGKGKEWVYREQWTLWESVYDEDVAVDVPAGAHRIRVDNAGGDWVRATRYTFTGCRVLDRPALLVAALRSPSVTIAWVQNTESDWFNHQAGTVAPVAPARLALPGFADGAYRVEWWETWTGKPARTETVQARGGALVLLPGEIATDTAARITPANANSTQR